MAEAELIGPCSQLAEAGGRTPLMFMAAAMMWRRPELRTLSVPASLRFALRERLSLATWLPRRRRSSVVSWCREPATFMAGAATPLESFRSVEPPSKALAYSCGGC